MLSATFDVVLATTAETRPVPAGTPADASDSLLRIPEIASLAGPVATWHSSAASVHSRRWHRVAFEKTIVVTPLDGVREFPQGEPFTAMGRDISLTGISFLHRDPLASRKVAVSLLLDDGSYESFVTVLRWCRFRRDGMYQSGGRFLRAIAIELKPADIEAATVLPALD